MLKYDFIPWSPWSEIQESPYFIQHTFTIFYPTPCGTFKKPPMPFMWLTWWPLPIQVIWWEHAVAYPSYPELSSFPEFPDFLPGKIKVTVGIDMCLRLTLIREADATSQKHLLGHLVYTVVTSYFRNNWDQIIFLSHRKPCGYSTQSHDMGRYYITGTLTEPITV